MQGQRRFGRAVIIGGSMAGLMGARILSDHFEQVTVLERDPLPTGPDPRKSVPQGRHLHGFLAGGRDLLGKLFPGLEQEMLAEGAILSDAARDTAWFHCGSWKTRYISGIEYILSTRLFLEWKLRGRVATLPNVRIRYGCTVDSLLMDVAKTRVTGVQLKTSEGDETLEADLIVDTAGRGSRAAHWLEALGFGRPEEEEIVVNLGYASRLYEAPQDAAPDWRFLYVSPRPPGGWRSGLVQCVEGGRWMVTFVSYFGDYPPTDEQGFLEFARSLPTQDVYEAIKNARPLTEATLHKVPSSLWRHYERMERLPENFVTLGDAVCAFNPVYGQGMTVASLSARLLGECIEKLKASSGELQGLTRDFQRKLAKLLSGPWTLGASSDLRYPKAQGRRFAGLGLVHWSLDTLADMTSQNVAACHKFHEVVHMRRGPETWLTPDFLASFITYGIKSFFVPLPQRAMVNTRPPPPPA